MTDSIILGGLIRSKQPARDKLAADVEAFMARGGKIVMLGHGEVSGKTEQEIFAGCRTLKKSKKP